MKILSLLPAALFLLPLPFCAQTAAADQTDAPGGTLVIVGGALEAGNAEVIGAFLKAATPAEGVRRIGIVPAASSRPVKSPRDFRDALVRHGASPEEIVILPLAAVDSEETPEVDESAWVGNGRDEKLAEEVRGFTGIWMVGGDQTRLTQVLLEEHNSDTPVFAAVREVFANGGVLGGTSAGAAVMSDPMIAGGTSIAAWTEGLSRDYPGMESQENGPLVLQKGFGFFKDGIVDQHFDAKARLGRLIRACWENRETHPLGFGVDENTAMIYHAGEDVFTIAGAGSVVVVDVRKAEAETRQGRLALGGVRLSTLSPGDRYVLSTREATPAEGLLPTIGKEYLSIREPRAMGLFSPYGGRLDHFLAYSLVDNASASEALSYGWDARGEGYALRFYQDEDTRGYWGTPEGSASSYTVLNACLDLVPVRVTIEPLR